MKFPHAFQRRAKPAYLLGLGLLLLSLEPFAQAQSASSKAVKRKSNVVATSKAPEPEVATSEPAAGVTGLPLFYKDVVPFDSVKHKDLALPRQWDDFSYAGRTNAIPVTVTEASLALRDYPLVFIKDPVSGIVNFVALVGSGDGINQFVDSKGKWQANTYIPAWVRRYPFLMVTDDKQNSFLAFDPQAQLLTKKTERESLLDADGKPTSRLQQVLAFQREYAAAANLTAQLGQKLLEAGVLEEARLTLQTADRQAPVNLGGLLLVNEKKIRDLAIAELEKLHAADALGLAYAQIFSMTNLRKLRLPETSANK